ncbi:MAG TPA: hypothetical protein VIV65_05800, partial [Gemmatimonadaceae bacterium]
LAILIGPALLILTFRTYTRDWSRTFAFSTIVLAFMVATGLRPLILAINSLLSIRSSFAMLVPLTMMLPWSLRRRAMITGLAMGVSILMGTEQGLAVILAYVLVAMMVAIRTKQWRAMLEELGIALVTAAAVYVVFVGMIGGMAGVRGAFRFNFKLIPMDQYWYFGVPPNDFIGSWGRLWPRLITQPMTLIALVVGGAVAGVWTRRVWRGGTAATAMDRSLAVMLLYGLIACVSLLGILLVTYVEPLIRCVFIVSALFVGHLIDAREATPVEQRTRSLLTLPRVGLVALVGIVLGLPLPLLKSYVRQPPHLLTAHLIGGRGQMLESYWTETMASGQRLMDAHRGPDGRPPVLWSTYAGLLEARNGEFQPSTDYIIHVLGPANRQAYLADFRRVRPTLVQTVLPTYSIYEAWIEQTSWDFYRDLLRDYRVAGMTPWSVMWERRATPGPEPRDLWQGSVSPTEQAVELPIPAPRGNSAKALLLEVEVSYRVKNPLGFLPIVGSVPRYLVLESGTMHMPAVTLDPYRGSQRFPILALEGKKVRLDFRTYSLLPGARLEVDSVRLREIPQTPDMYPWLLNLGCAATPDCSGTSVGPRP